MVIRVWEHEKPEEAARRVEEAVSRRLLGHRPGERIKRS